MKKQLKRGEIPVNKKNLIEHCSALHDALNKLDETMKEKESFERGRKISKIANEINLSLHRIEHFELGIPLDKLGTKCILDKRK